MDAMGRVETEFTPEEVDRLTRASERLAAFGLSAQDARSLAPILLSLDLIFPTPSVEDIDKASIVMRQIWEVQVWQELLGHAAEDSPDFGAAAQGVAAAVVHSGAWSLLGYLNFVGWTVSPAVQPPSPVLYAAPPHAAVARRAVQIDKVERLLIGEAEARELRSMSSTIVERATHFLSRLDAQALAGNALAALATAMAEANLPPLQPTSQVFGWLWKRPQVPLTMKEVILADTPTWPIEIETTTRAAAYGTVRVFWATDREPSKEFARGKPLWFGANRGALRMGCADVTVPHEHRRGRVETPSLRRLEVREHTHKHISVDDVQPLRRDVYFQDVREALGRSEKRACLIFVHGFNTTFVEAARRSAQIAKDLRFRATPIFFSWPTRKSINPQNYVSSGQSVVRAASNLKKFMSDLISETDPKEIYFIAHSMGSQALVGALVAASAKAEARKRIREIVLAAPDIDAEVFEGTLAPQLLALGIPMTLYASSRDRALRTSKRINEYRRVGDTLPTPTIAPPMETIDASSVNTDFLGHGYFAESREVLSDLFYLFRHGLRADERDALQPSEIEGQRYWRFVH